MLGIVWDVTKLVDRIFDRHIAECHYLRGLVTNRDMRIKELEAMLSTPNAVESIEPARGEAARRIRNWREQRRVLEQKFRPPELKEREQCWRGVADSVEQEVEQNASEVG